MLIVIIDFRSRHTVTHTMITASTAVQLGDAAVSYPCTINRPYGLRDCFMI